MKLYNILPVICTVALLCGCQSLAPGTELVVTPSLPASHAAAPAGHEIVATGHAVAAVDPIPASADPPPEVVAPAVPPADLWQRIGSELNWHAINNASVMKARDRYLRQGDYLPVVSARGALYLYYIVEEVQKRGLPMEIALLPLVESTLDPFASSSSRAAGLWQIMPATGKHLGLQQDWWYDGRRAVRDSTRVALDYLQALHRQFDQDWLLALAAYNSGKGRVARAQRANQRNGISTDYWSLKLPAETRNYVPRLIALAQIVADPDAFAVTIPPIPNEPAFEVAATDGQLEIARAAALAGVDVSTVRALNPGQLRWATAPDGPADLLLPVGTAARFSEGVAALAPDDRVQWARYRIERGDSLIRIARKFDTQVDLLRAVNGIRGSKIRAGNTLMIPRGSDWAASLALATPAEVQRRGYRVRRGDSLYLIAGRFNVSINDIIDWNGLDPGKYLKPGQQLTLYVSKS